MKIYINKKTLTKTVLLFFFLINNLFGSELVLKNNIKENHRLYEILKKKDKEEIRSNTKSYFPMLWNKFYLNQSFDPSVSFFLKNYKRYKNKKEFIISYKRLCENPKYEYYLFSKTLDFITNQKNHFSKFTKLHFLDFFKTSKNHSIHLANNYFRKNYKKPKDQILNGRDYYAIYNWTKEGSKNSTILDQQYTYGKINWWLGQKNLPNDAWEVIDNLVFALKKLPDYKGIVYSGQPTYNLLNYRLNVGDIVNFGGFLPTTPNKKIANQFRAKYKSGFLFKIKTINGKEISFGSKYSGEKEVLLYPFKNFIVKRLTNSEVYLEETNNFSPAKSMTTGLHNSHYWDISNILRRSK